MCAFAAARNKVVGRKSKNRTCAQAFEDPLRQTQPLVVLGMHRSGTSLAVRLLTDLGVHMGAWLSKDAESVFFQKLNRRIYRAAGADWAMIDPLLTSMSNTDFVEKQIQKILPELFGEKFLSGGRPGIAAFFGTAQWQRLSQDPRLSWGWKDPRTTLLFPIWLQVFPQARIVHIIRNGIDVAISTHRRSLKQQRKLRNRVLAFDYKPSTLDFDYCFHLWEAYVTFVLEHQHMIPQNQYLEIRYENLLRDPFEQLQRLLAFNDYPVSNAQLAQVCQQINPTRLDNSEYAGPYVEQIKKLHQSNLMQALGYS